MIGLCVKESTVLETVIPFSPTPFLFLVCRSACTIDITYARYNGNDVQKGNASQKFRTSEGGGGVFTAVLFRSETGAIPYLHAFLALPPHFVGTFYGKGERRCSE